MPTISPQAATGTARPETSRTLRWRAVSGRSLTSAERPTGARLSKPFTSEATSSDAPAAASGVARRRAASSFLMGSVLRHPRAPVVRLEERAVVLLREEAEEAGHVL